MIWPGCKLFLVNLHPDHIYPSGGFSSSRVNWVKLVQESEQLLDPSIFQSSSMRFSCLTSKFASPASGNESWGCGRDPSDYPRKSTLLSPWNGRCRTKVDVLRSWSPPRVLTRPSAIAKINLSFWADFRCVHRLQLLKVCDQHVTLPNSPRIQSVSKEQSR